MNGNVDPFIVFALDSFFTAEIFPKRKWQNPSLLSEVSLHRFHEYLLVWRLQGVWPHAADLR
jgi:hypothetical protein